MAQQKNDYDDRSVDGFRMQIEELKLQFVEIDFIMKGSLIERYGKCGKINCKCHKAREYLHGPYFQLTYKEKAKTITKNLTKLEHKWYCKCIENRQKLMKIINKMFEISNEAAQYILKNNNTKK